MGDRSTYIQSIPVSDSPGHAQKYDHHSPQPDDSVLAELRPARHLRTHLMGVWHGMGWGWHGGMYGLIIGSWMASSEREVGSGIFGGGVQLRSMISIRSHTREIQGLVPFLREAKIDRKVRPNGFANIYYLLFIIYRVG